METKILESEKFDTIKELANLQTNISNGRAVLKKLHETTEEYMVIREEKAEKRVLEILEQSRIALEEINNNHKELSSYNSELQAYAIELKTIDSNITTLFQDFKEQMEKADINMKKRQGDVSETLKMIKLQRVHVAEDREMLDRDRAEIRDGWRLLKDRQQTLKEGFEELKAKQQ